MADTLPRSSRRRQASVYSITDSHDPPTETQRVSVPIPQSLSSFTPTLKSPLTRFQRVKTIDKSVFTPPSSEPAISRMSDSMSDATFYTPSPSHSPTTSTDNLMETCTTKPASENFTTRNNKAGSNKTNHTSKSTTASKSHGMSGSSFKLTVPEIEWEKQTVVSGSPGANAKVLSSQRKLLLNRLVEALDQSNERRIATASINYPPKAPALQNSNSQAAAPATTPTNQTLLLSAASSASSCTSNSGSLLSSQTVQTSVFSPVRSFTFHDDIPNSNVNYSPKHSQQPANFNRNTKNLSLNLVHDHHQQHKHHLSHIQPLATPAQPLDESQPNSTTFQTQLPGRSLSLLIPNQAQIEPDTSTPINNNNSNKVFSGNEAIRPNNSECLSDSTGTGSATLTSTNPSEGLTTNGATTTSSKINDTTKFGKSNTNSDDNTSMSDSTNSIFDSQIQPDDLDLNEDTFSNEVVPQFSRMLLPLGKFKFGFPEELQESSQLEAYPQGPRSVFNDLIYLYGDPQKSKVAVDIKQYDLVINVAKECQNLQDQFDTCNNSKEYLFVPWTHTSLILKELPFLTKKISEYLSLGKKILVHCQCGVSRSACVIVAFFMMQFQLLVNEAYELLKSGSDSETGKSDRLKGYHINACERICPNMSLIFELMDFNEVLQGLTTPTGK
ncbi:uncharacterized protein KQ657_001854 [Scheffersomyces spartinae]|uniref:protein-tyrosine-phosphatase n=1 Tax=Scheffersomyces spartinae TaxID=45513 RepID=A0A9P7V7C2_9ASCO|nr:uncharacterized protein KQ657_001854 [Scheffersomyces spartinae]KAG7192453.1 hypothetical protein KQ657_001854 [Scheffersomyces spartinae]